jgi:hypothetical protein
MSERQKYIMVDNGEFKDAILFPPSIKHSDAARSYRPSSVVSAGVL